MLCQSGHRMMGGMPCLAKIMLHISLGPAIVAGHVAVVVLCRSMSVDEPIWLEVRYKLQRKTGVRLTHGACSPKTVTLRVCQRPPIQPLHMHRSVVPVWRPAVLNLKSLLCKQYFGKRKKFFVSGCLAQLERAHGLEGLFWSSRASSFDY